MVVGKKKRLSTESSELRSHAEERLKDDTPEADFLLKDTETQRLLHELEVHRIELEIQNSELRQARDEVERSLERYSDLFDFAPMGYFTLDLNGAISAVNLRGAGLLGIERSSLLGQRFGLYIAALARPAFDEFLAKIFVSPAREVCEVNLLNKGNTPLFVQIEGLLAASGRECRIALTDITQLKQMEEQVLRLASFPQLNPNPVLEVETSGKVAYSNPATQTTLKMLGIAGDDATVFIPSDLNELMENWDKNDDVTFYREVVIKDRIFGETIFLSHQFNVARIYTHDITERKRMDIALKESEALYRSIGESIDYGVWVCAPDGRNTYASESFLKMVGITQDQCSNFGWGNVLHPDDAEHTIAAWQECVRTGSKWDIEHRFMGVDGQWCHILARGVPVKNDLGEITCWAGINLDITDQKRTQEALTEKKLKLEELNRTLEVRVSKAVDEMRFKDQAMIRQNSLAAMGEMINNIAHQWRQPLNTISLIIQFVQSGYASGELTSEEMDSDIQIVMENIMHMSQTIEDFRNFFKHDKVKQEFFIGEAVNRAISLVSASLEDHNIKVEIKTVDDATIIGYQNEYSQVLLNIISNTCDACVEHNVSNPRIFISISQENKRSVLLIRDNCGGIPDNVISKIFDPYFTTRGPDKGNGIGLYMSKMIIEQNMGGHLTASNVAGGAEFRIEV